MILKKRMFSANECPVNCLDTAEFPPIFPSFSLPYEMVSPFRPIEKDHIRGRRRFKTFTNRVHTVKWSWMLVTIHFM